MRVLSITCVPKLRWEGEEKGGKKKREWRASLLEDKGHHPHGVNIRKQVDLTCWGEDLASPF